MWYAKHQANNGTTKKENLPELTMRDAEQEHWQGMLESLNSSEPKVSAGLQSRLGLKVDLTNG